MGNRILCGIDASPASACAAGVTARLGRDLGSESVLMHVEPPRPAGRAAPAGIVNARERGRLHALVDANGFPPTTRAEVVGGDPAGELVAAAGRHDAELLVVGARGTAPSGPPLGAIAAHAMRRAPCPVVVTPPTANPVAFAARGVHLVVCAIGETSRESEALRLATHLCERLGSRMRVLHLFRAGLTDPAQSLLGLAEEMCADLVVAAGLNGAGACVAEAIASGANRPVMVLPPQAHLGAGSGHYELSTSAA